MCVRAYVYMCMYVCVRVSSHVHMHYCPKLKKQRKWPLNQTPFLQKSDISRRIAITPTDFTEPLLINKPNNYSYFLALVSLLSVRNFSTKFRLLYI